MRPVADEVDLDDAVGGEADGRTRPTVSTAPSGDGPGSRPVRHAAAIAIGSSTAPCPHRSSRLVRLTEVGIAPAASPGSSGSCKRASRRAASSASAMLNPATCNDDELVAVRRVGAPPRLAERTDLEQAAAHRRHRAAFADHGEDRHRGCRSEIAAQRARARRQQFGTVGHDHDVPRVAVVQPAEHIGDGDRVVGRDDEGVGVGARTETSHAATSRTSPMTRRRRPRRRVASRPAPSTWRAGSAGSAPRPAHATPPSRATLRRPARSSPDGRRDARPRARPLPPPG